MWLVRIRRDEGSLFKITNCTYVCSEHFSLDNFKRTLTGIRKLKEGTVPTVFQWNNAKAERPPPKKRPFVLDHQLQEKHMKHADAAPADGDDIHQPIPSQDHDYVTDPLPLSDAEKLELSTQYIATLEARLQAKINQRFCIERFSTDEYTLNMYTGFKSYACLKAVFESLQPTAFTMTRWSQIQRKRLGVDSKEDPFRCETLPLIDQFFLFLCRIRQGHNEHDLAIRFGVSTSTVSRLLITWVNYLYFMLGSLPIWPSKSRVNANMPECFKVTYPNTRVIVDCTELRAQTPSAKVLNSETYSNYKSHTTFKGLIGITPCGAISFISALHTGSISDKEITKVSGLIDLLDVGDEVMADKGFLIQDLLQKVGAKVVVPPFLGLKGHFSKK
ncbi:uncharacterized protein LOC110463521 [Mizuhopecten yessoensis]|uniref:uncharacterized protein LOC110463521 n=1 Tax=Mizuhopecten yessoensis TaxID=6573 RepID=UPI000B45C7DA|nr:uncharacterized protein LOC110463521 [Mizuhopecten yessoensis]